MLPFPDLASLHQCFMGSAVYFQSFHGCAQAVLARLTRSCLGLFDALGTPGEQSVTGHYGDIRFV